MAADAMALLYSLLGGFFMGTYPVPIKSPEVLAAKVHPVVFQCYKSFWVFVTGWIFVLANVIQGQEIIFQFSWWGIISAASWIPAGLCTIAAVPRLGVGLAIVCTAGSAAALSFVFFWLAMGETMRQHDVVGHVCYLAPAYLAAVILGMVVLVLSPTGRCLSWLDGSAEGEDVELTTESAVACREEGPSPQESFSQSFEMSTDDLAVAPPGFAVGLTFALVAGVFAVGQFATMSLGQRLAEEADGCRDDPSTCSPAVTEEFDAFGSWLASFGIGAASVSLFWLLFWNFTRVLRNRPALDLHFKVLRVPGSVAGIFWSLGNFFQTAAVMRGGSAVMMPSNMSIYLITSGAWGLFYYKEVNGRGRMAVWVGAAAWTLCGIVLLSRERVSAA